MRAFETNHYPRMCYKNIAVVLLPNDYGDSGSNIFVLLFMNTNNLYKNCFAFI